MITEENVGDRAVLTAPIALGDEYDSEYRAPNMLQVILSLLKNVRPGADLTRIPVPPLLNLPKSHLQLYGETVYSTNVDLLSKVANGETSVDRFIAAVAWSISTTRHLSFGISPYNPILGETHHVSKGSLNVLVEQVSHHPPVSALYATDEKDNIQLLWCHNHVPKFTGTKVDVEVRGERELKILNKKETYIMNTPNLVFRILPFPGVEWQGNVSIRCQETGLKADICYKGTSFLSRKDKNRSLVGKIFRSSSSSSSSSFEAIYEISGNWDRTVAIKDTRNGEVKVIYNAKQAFSGLKTPVVKLPKEVVASESGVVWAEVNKGILKKQWDKAKEAKSSIEERQRELERERVSKGETWIPKHFKVSYNKENGWQALPCHKLVPPAPIVVPTS
ncbi:PREDICTED: oxysterol-binding protein-related protein 4C-like isoform X2 [Ipomoea nil]|uniref:oxysterol-binding protein-related protein 4C-like isoform X2 n=1 Tax=Ipomoea nil TaxID=35883 RepID=UPI00090191AC|nr:PREDICTED: oxysterol-binding protein-related protein 4C-like isoform X2 [Ipomoea nil]